jgi:protein-tyrosine-phosphatase
MEIPFGSRARPARLLFVCVENSCRSQMAEAFARQLGGEGVEAYSAGSRPCGQVRPKVVAAMKEVGYDLRTHRSKPIGEVASLEFDVAVDMGCGDLTSQVRACRYESWDIPVPKDLPPEPFRAVRDQIEERVRQLLAGLNLPCRSSS